MKKVRFFIIGIIIILSFGYLILGNFNHNSLNNYTQKNESDLSYDMENDNPIIFEKLDGSREDMNQIDITKWYDYSEINELFAKYLENKSITFNQISKSLDDVLFQIEYDIKYGDEELLTVESTWWYPIWKLYNGEKLIGEGDNILYFEKQGKHFILCYDGDEGISCILDGEQENIGYSISLNNAQPKIYKGDIYKVKWLGDGEYSNFGVYKNNEELFTFEADHPTDFVNQSLVVDDNGWWLFYQTIKYGDEGIFFHLVHNGKDLGEINGWDEVVGLYNYQGKAFYIYKKDGLIYYNLDGIDYKTEFEDIIHNQCCGGADYNIKFRDSVIAFYGKKDGTFSLYKGIF